MARKPRKIEIAQLTDVSIDDIIDRYIKILTTPKKNVNDKIVMAVRIEDCVVPDDTIIVKSKPNRSILCHKFLFLLHLIISKCIRSRENSIQLNSIRLEDVLGNDYSYMLDTLHDMKIINLSAFYEVGEYCRSIKLLDWNIKKETLPNLKVIEYLEKWKRLTSEAKKKYKKIEIVPSFDENGKLVLIKNDKRDISKESILFIENYNNSLSFLEMKYNKEDSIDYVNSLFSSHDSHRYYYYLNCIEEYSKNKNKIYSIDEQDRIYHCLTSLPKKLKPLFNIKYQLDIANSHPLLFSRILINKYKIDNSILKIIYNINREEYIDNIHYATEFFYKVLNNNCIGVPIDIIKYIYVCSKGMIWDDFTTIFSEYTRDEVKVRAFKEIFYPKNNITPFTEFGKKFIEEYPNVYKTIREIKKVERLPLLMMKIESRIMRRILSVCFTNGWKVVNIHDALVILDVVDNNNADPLVFKKIINDIYREYMLHPTIHYEEF